MVEEELYASLDEDLKPFRALMAKAADAVLDQEVSSYPIFVVHQHDLEIGIPLVKQGEKGAKWSIHASSLEELATKKIIGMDKVDDFRSIYKDPEAFLCYFIVDEGGATFVFGPR